MQPPSAADAAFRPRDSAATRRAILASASAAFARLGYDGAGLREIAREAGVDPRLIGRYFGSKENLFAEVVDEVYKKPLMIAPGATREAAIALLSDTAPAQLDGMLLTLRSASSERAVEIMRASIERNYQSDLADLLPGPDGPGRAALLVSICAGVQLMRNVMGSTPLSGDEVAHLVPYLQAALDAVVADPLDRERVHGVGRRVVDEHQEALEILADHDPDGDAPRASGGPGSDRP